MEKSYLIVYTSYDSFGSVLKQGKMRVRNCDSELQAKIKLDKFFDKSVPNHSRLEIESCTPDILTDKDFNMDTAFGGIFKDIFK